MLSSFVLEPVECRAIWLANPTAKCPTAFVVDCFKFQFIPTLAKLCRHHYRAVEPPSPRYSLNTSSPLTQIFRASSVPPSTCTSSSTGDQIMVAK